MSCGANYGSCVLRNTIVILVTSVSMWSTYVSTEVIRLWGLTPLFLFTFTPTQLQGCASSLKLSQYPVYVYNAKEATIHQVSTMLATSKNVLFPGHDHLLTTGTDDLRWSSGDNQSVRSSVLVVSMWLWPGNRTFLKVVSMVDTWWIVAFLCSSEQWCNEVYVSGGLHF